MPATSPIAWDPPSEGTRMRYDRALALAARAHASEVERTSAMVDLLRDIAKDTSLGTTSPTAPEPAGLRESLARATQNDEAAKARVASVDALRSRLRTDPASLFLPVGALVRMRAPFRPETWHGGRDVPPAPGSLGVVVGPARGRSEWSTKVAFLDYVDVSGRRRSGEAGNPLTLYLDADDVEVLDLARFADGTPCLSVDFVRTHARADDEDARVMVVEVDGHHWQIESDERGADGSFEAQRWNSSGDLDHLVALGDVPAGPTP